MEWCFEGVDTPECPVCLGTHDDDVHAATVDLHRWLRGEIARRVDPIPYGLAPVSEPLVAAVCMA